MCQALRGRKLVGHPRKISIKIWTFPRATNLHLPGHFWSAGHGLHTPELILLILHDKQHPDISFLLKSYAAKRRANIKRYNEAKPFQPRGAEQRKLKNQFDLAKTLSVTVLVFVLCLLPYGIIILLHPEHVNPLIKKVNVKTSENFFRRHHFVSSARVKNIVFSIFVDFCKMKKSFDYTRVFMCIVMPGCRRERNVSELATTLVLNNEQKSAHIRLRAETLYV